jgi:hypothetical protein
MKKLIYLVMLLALMSCKPTAPAVHNEAVEQKIVTVKGHITRSLTLLDITPFELRNMPVIKTELKAAVVASDEAIDENAKAKAETQKLTEELNNAKTNLETARNKAKTDIAEIKTQAKKDLETEQGKRIAAEKKYDNAWLAGKAWFWIHTIEITASVLAVAGLLLNYYTEWFVVIAKPIAIALEKLIVGVCGGAVKGFWQLLCWCGNGIKGIFAKKKA